MAYAEPMPPRMGLKTVLFRFACYKHVAPTELANDAVAGMCSYGVGNDGH